MAKKRLIRINKQALSKIVRNAVSNILKETASYGSRKSTGSCNIYDYFEDALYDTAKNVSEEELNSFSDYLDKYYNDFNVYADIDVEYDETVGWGTEAFPYYTLEDINTDYVQNIINGYNGSPELMKAANEAIDIAIKNLEIGDFEIDDYPEYDDDPDFD